MRLLPSQENAILASPMVLFLLALLGFPVVLSIIYGFSEASFQSLMSPKLIGIANFQLVLQDSAFWDAAWFSLRFGVITALLECVLGLFLAVYLAPLIRENGWMVAVLIIPMIVAPAMIGLMYRLVLHEFAGPVPYYFYEWLGWSPSFLSTGMVFQTIVVAETLQWTPFAFLLFLTAYQAIPQDIREAAAVDGTRPWRMFWKIELPQMLPTLFVAGFIRFIDGFRVFDNIYTLVGAGPGGSTTSMSIYIYETFLRRGEIGKAMAAAILLFVVAFAILALGQSLMRKRR
ncbi:carbohydrate ABC transporter permease [Roseibium marinum]|uniref:Multiple sugar transport system permease protein n=1 Tax=Roseibium marinum TaxID=281252 RepID=A0A2S3UJR9_9HYPH|nr:sugar ABC transporter permease [Roseibium marinum]POF27956.1 multiple sugar transport system permease protein [Roseibium marinum]